MSLTEQIPTAVAMQLVGSKKFGNYCVIYDLKDGQEWKRFDLPRPIFTDEDLTQIYEKLLEECPSKIVKSVFVNMLSIIPPHLIYHCLVEIDAFGRGSGYLNYNYASDLVFALVTELLAAKKKGKIYETGDCVIIGRYLALPCLISEIHLLKKQEIGWDILDGKVGESSDIPNNFVTSLLDKNGIKPDQLKDVFLKVNDRWIFQLVKKIIKRVYPKDKLSIDYTTDETKENLEGPGEYLAKVYAGEDYFTDYDCFLGCICAENFELQCGETCIVLPVQFKRVPCTIQKKIKFNKCETIKLLGSCDHLANLSGMGKRVLLEARIKLNDEVGLVTLHVDQFKKVYFKIEKTDEGKTLMLANLPLNTWPEDDLPLVIFGNDYISVDYFKDGLHYKLKDENGNIKIPFRISFDEEIHVGDAALQHPEYLLPNISLEACMFDKIMPEFAEKRDDFVLDTDGKYKLLLKTFHGIQKTFVKNVSQIFFRSVFKLLISKTGKNVNEFRCDYRFEHDCNCNSS